MNHKGLRVTGRSGSVLFVIFIAFVLWFDAGPIRGMDQKAGSSENSASQYRKEIPYGGEKLTLVSDSQEKVGPTSYRASGNAVLTFLDMILTCDEIEYDTKNLRIATRGETEFRNKRAALSVSGAEFDFDTQSVILHDVSGYFYDPSGKSDRVFFLTGGMAQNIQAKKVEIHWGDRGEE